ncbi:MAG: hypothetical protein WC969_06170 [Elusimicrobiota bacterium]|jgi:hypothetical protein
MNARILKIKIAVAALTLATLGALAVSRTGAQDTPTASKATAATASNSATSQNSYDSGYQAGYKQAQNNFSSEKQQLQNEADNASKSSGCCGGSGSSN